MGDYLAKRLFDNQPHKHPQGRFPEWDIHPEMIKNVFRAKAKGANQ